MTKVTEEQRDNMVTVLRLLGLDAVKAGDNSMVIRTEKDLDESRNKNYVKIMP